MLSLGKITRVHIHARFEEDLLNTSTVISKISFEQRGMSHQDNQQFQPIKTLKTPGPQVHKILKDVRFLLATYKDKDNFS